MFGDIERLRHRQSLFGKNPQALIRRVLIVISTLAVFWGTASGQQDSTASEQAKPQGKSYFFSSDPGLELLKVRYVGGSTGGIVSYSVYADGRFVYRLTDATNDETVYEAEARLTHDELLALLDLAVDGGLIEFDEESTIRQMESTSPIGYLPDSSTMILDILLPNYQKSAESEATTVSKSIRAKAPIWRAQRYPEIQELQALASIARSLNDYKSRAEANHESAN